MKADEKQGKQPEKAGQFGKEGNRKLNEMEQSIKTNIFENGCKNPLDCNNLNN